MSRSPGSSFSRHPSRQGAIGVIYVELKFLVIRRSEFVRAPRKFCFPGGGIEPGETEEEALVREMQEELSIDVQPVRRLWTNRARSGIELHWWHAEMHGERQIQANREEVESIHWMTAQEMLALNDLLPTNREFLHSLLDGKFVIGE